jgi:Uma2 family endonuclease
MTTEVAHREFIPGTTGWSVDDLDDPEIERRWYAEAQIPNYWLLDAHERSLECLVLEGNDYRVDQSGKDEAELRPSMFPGLLIPLARLWAE